MPVQHVVACIIYVSKFLQLMTSFVRVLQSRLSSNDETRCKLKSIQTPELLILLNGITCKRALAKGHRGNISAVFALLHGSISNLHANSGRSVGGTVTVFKVWRQTTGGTFLMGNGDEGRSVYFSQFSGARYYRTQSAIAVSPFPLRDEGHLLSRV